MGTDYRSATPASEAVATRREVHMALDFEVFEHALALFHSRSLQNDEAVRQLLARGSCPLASRRLPGP